MEQCNCEQALELKKVIQKIWDYNYSQYNTAKACRDMQDIAFKAIEKMESK